MFRCVSGPGKAGRQGVARGPDHVQSLRPAVRAALQACHKSSDASAVACDTGYVACHTVYVGCASSYGSRVKASTVAEICTKSFVACLKGSSATGELAIRFEGGDGTSLKTAVVGARNEMEGNTAENVWTVKRHAGGERSTKR